ncbi:MAG: TolC family protein [Methylococcales bacterium]|nr:TolC family protein [Methylococcales bacterium]
MIKVVRFFYKSIAVTTILMFPVSGISDNLNVISTVDDLYSNIDPFSTQESVPISPAKNMMANKEHACHFNSVGSPLSLLEAVERSLCNNPKTRQTWASVKAQAAFVGENQAAYLPTLNATVSGAYGIDKTDVKGFSDNFSRDNETVDFSYNLDLTWVLFDFGLRSANLTNARQLLAAANATQDATLQAVFVETAKSYYDLLSAMGAFNASVESEKSARKSFMAADAMYKAGTGTLADKLQAQTKFAQATLDRVKAIGELKNAHGTLAITMGLDANTPLVVNNQRRELPNTAFVKSVDALIKNAKQNHPSLIAAQAQVRAAKAKVGSAKAEGLPSVSLSGRMSYNDQAGTQGDTVTDNSNIGLQVNIPLFEGLGRSYKIQSAKADVELKNADLASEEQKISLEVWTSYHSLQTETENLKATDNLSQSATQSYQVAHGRYKAGIGTIIELLNAQSTLADSKQQRIAALSNWRIARLKLASSLGKLGFWAL